MNPDRNIKLLLMKLNMSGQDVSLIKEQRYSKEFKIIYSRYKLTFWIPGKKLNKKTGLEEDKSIPLTHEFKSSIELLKFMVVKANEGKT